ncbi:MAG: DUF790 family protein [Deltaproteobacteria bacterium]|nr:DUF790 family protein [Deltaproteobacteria bacterium]
MRLDQLPIRISGRDVLPAYLGAADRPWLRALLERVEAFNGARWRELNEVLRHPVVDHAPARKQALAALVLRKRLGGRVRTAAPPATVRAEVFRIAAEEGSRAAAMGRAAVALGMSAAEIEDTLFGDLPGERVVVVPALLPSPADLAAEANLHLCKMLLARASGLEVALHGNARAVVRLARLRGLLCVVERRDTNEDVTLRVSGPMALFRKTALYGRALGTLLGALSWSDRFLLTAQLQLGETGAELRIASGDPIDPRSEPRRYDSAVEQRLARDLGRALPDWHIVREPEPIAAGKVLVFPDFSLTHRFDPQRRWLLEVVGFWTPEYLTRKLERYRSVAGVRIIFCIDAALGVGDEALPAGCPVVRYRRRVDPLAIVRLVGAR